MLLFVFAVCRRLSTLLQPSSSLSNFGNRVGRRTQPTALFLTHRQPHKVKRFRLEGTWTFLCLNDMCLWPIRPTNSDSLSKAIVSGWMTSAPLKWKQFGKWLRWHQITSVTSSENKPNLAPDWVHRQSLRPWTALRISPSPWPKNPKIWMDGWWIHRFMDGGMGGTSFLQLSCLFPLNFMNIYQNWWTPQRAK